MNAKTLLESFEILAEAPGGIDRLREAILSLATDGHLTEQDDSEPKPKFAHANGPSALPSNWVWTTLAEIASYGGNGNVSPSVIHPTDWVLDLEDIEKGTSRLIEKVIARKRPTRSNKTKFNAGDVLYGKLRPYLDKVLVADSQGYCTTEIVPIVPNRGIDPYWLRISLKSPRFLSYVSAKSYGMKMPRLGTKDALSSLHAVPPLLEQKRIVAKVDELMALCDQLEQQQKLRDNIRTAARKSAISELVTAKTSEEILKSWKRISENWSVIATDGESLVNIEETVLKLAASGRFDRSGQDISSETDLPGTWKLKKFGELVEFSMGKTPPTKDATYWGGANSTMWISISDMVDGGEVLTSQRSVSLRARRESFRRDPWPVGTLLMSFKLTIGKVSRLGAPGYFNEAIIAFKSDSKELDEYLFRVLPVLAAAGDSKGAVKGSTLNSKSISELQIPLPPEDELKRVTTQIDELINLCRGLHAELERRDLLATQFARSAGKS